MATANHLVNFRPAPSHDCRKATRPPAKAASAHDFHDQPTRHLDVLALRAARAFVDSGLHGVKASVVAAVDVSTPMAPLFLSGQVHALTLALLALGMRFDDDGVVPLWAFGNDARRVGELRRGDHASFIDRHVRPPAPSAASQIRTAARLAPLIDAICHDLFPREWENPGAPYLREARETPVFVIVLTSGDCHDIAETTRLLRRASHLPIFWQFAAIPPPGAPSDLAFLRTISALPGTFIDSCGFFEPRDVTDERALFAGLLNEFPRYLWLPAVQSMLLGRPPAPELRADAEDEVIARTLLALPHDEADRRARARLARERRRAERAAQSAPEASPASSEMSQRALDLARLVRTLRAKEWADELDPTSPDPGATPLATPTRRDAEDGEDTVTTAPETLARRARREARSRQLSHAS